MRVSGKVRSAFSANGLADHGVDYDVAARLAELDLVVTDLTRANERVAAVERRNVSFTRMDWTG